MSEQQQNIGTALQDVTTHAKALVQGEIELAKAEVTIKAKKLGKGAAIAAAAGVFVLAALILILHGVAWLIWYYGPFPDSAFFWGFFIEALILLILAAVAGLLAKKAFSQGSPPKPEMAMAEAQRIKTTVEEARR